MNKRERLEATISGRPVDRVAVAAWRHQPVDDQKAESFAASTLAFQRDYDFDFVKVTPASSYCIRHWGTEDTWSGHPHGTREYVKRPISRLEDWNKLEKNDPHEGQMGEMLRALTLIHAELGEKTPFIQTIFSPLTQARNLVGGPALKAHLRQSPGVIHAALQIITVQTLSFVEAARATGISGIFYAMQWANYTHLSENEYREFGQPYDLQILEGSQDMWLNVLHLHGEEIMFSLAASYPAAILNWHDRESDVSLEDGLKKWPGAVCGGVRQEATLVQGTPADIKNEAQNAIRATESRRFVLGTGCVTPIVAPNGNIRALRDTVRTTD